MNLNKLSLLIISIALMFAIVLHVSHADEPQMNWTVIDGDTIRHGERVIRFWGIDAPEINQRCLEKDGLEYKCGVESKTALEVLIMDKPLVCEFLNKDRYDRDIAKCYLDGVDIAGLMVSLGQAIDYRRYSKGYYAAEQFQAQKKALGLWKGEFQEPSDYRRSNRSL